MNQAITAIFDNGVLKPEQPLDLPAGAKVRLFVVPEVAPADLDASWDELEKLWDEVHLGPEATRLTRDQLHERD